MYVENYVWMGKFVWENSKKEKSIFSRKFLLSLNILSKILEIHTKCPERLTWGQNCWTQFFFLGGGEGEACIFYGKKSELDIKAN